MSIGLFTCSSFKYNSTLSSPQQPASRPPPVCCRLQGTTVLSSQNGSAGITASKRLILCTVTCLKAIRKIKWFQKWCLHLSSAGNEMLQHKCVTIYLIINIIGKTQAARLTLNL